MKLARTSTSLSRSSSSPRSPSPPTQPVVLEGKDGPGKGKHIVLISGDQEYRSEETIPQLAKILAEAPRLQVHRAVHARPRTARSTRTCNNIPGLEALKTADLMVIFTRFLNLPDDQMQHVADYLEAGKPVVGLRTSTHAFNIPKDQQVREVLVQRQRREGLGGRVRQAGARRDVGEPPRRARQGGHPRHHRRTGRRSTRS